MLFRVSHAASTPPAGPVAPGSVTQGVSSRLFQILPKPAQEALSKVLGKSGDQAPGQTNPASREKDLEACRKKFALSGKERLDSKSYFVKPDTSVDLNGIPTTSDLDLKSKKIEKRLGEYAKDIQVLAELMNMAQTHSVLVVLQGLDAAGKSGIVEHVLSGNPFHFRAYGFKAPTESEKKEHFLTRIRRQLPFRGILQVFDRSHYEDYVVPRVQGSLSEEKLENRLNTIKAFESAIASQDRQTIVIKLFLHVSPEIQKERLIERILRSFKRWKVSRSDWKDRANRSKIYAAYDAAISMTSKPHAPWYVVPMDNKEEGQLIAASIIRDALMRHYEKWIEAALVRGDKALQALATE